MSECPFFHLKPNAKGNDEQAVDHGGEGYLGGPARSIPLGVATIASGGLLGLSD